MTDANDGSVQEPYYEVVNADGNVTKVSLADVIDISKDMWKSGRANIIGLVGLQKIANKEQIVEKKFETHILPTNDNRQQHGVNIWVGIKGDSDPDNWVRGSGEASTLNTGKIIDENGTRKYEEYNFIDSKYRYAMADKRAYCRAILKFIRLFGVYSEVESRDFLKGKPNVDGYDWSNL